MQLILQPWFVNNLIKCQKELCHELMWTVIHFRDAENGKGLKTLSGNILDFMNYFKSTNCLTNTKFCKVSPVLHPTQHCHNCWLYNLKFKQL